ncbi:MAG: thioredoxin domain-containing protein [Parcubacteria group bacterium]|nr:thioredoxin domain-containing protein [Parcubacteria group bacterium]
MEQSRIIASILGAGLVVMLLFGVDLARNRSAEKAQFDFSGIARPTQYRESPSKGAANPKATVFEYADFACSHCAEFQAVIARILAAHPNEIRLVWKDFPFLSQGSKDAAAAARCAGQQGKFWEYQNWLFANQGDFSPSALLEGAARLGLDESRFTECRSDDTIPTLVERDFAEGQALGITETPTLVIGGVALVGAQPFEEVERVLMPFLKNGN